MNARGKNVDSKGRWKRTGSLLMWCSKVIEIKYIPFSTGQPQVNAIHNKVIRKRSIVLLFNINYHN